MTKRHQRTLLDRIWEAHVVSTEPDHPAVLYVDLHLVHEVTSPQAFARLRQRRLSVRCPERTVATMDHSTPTLPGAPVSDPEAKTQLDQLANNCSDFGITLYALGTEKNGIVHVMAPELGYTQPGMTVVCGDSHTSTHGAFGALAFGIGSSEVAHVLATQCLLQQRPQAYAVRLMGQLAAGVSAKDIILALIAEVGTGGGTGCVFEFLGPGARALAMESRMTLCNMSIEAGARAGMVPPDDTTFAYLADRPMAPKGEHWDQALAHWRTLQPDPEADYAKTTTLDLSAVAPMLTYGTNPAMGLPITEPVPTPADIADPNQRRLLDQALRYMDLEPGRPLLGQAIDVVFVGSCTNSRLSDLRQAASIMRHRRVATGVEVLVVPGSQEVKRQAEAEGLDRVFDAAGAQWREPGCSMCIAMNGDSLQPGQRAISTSNRNFEGRQGKLGRTMLASPLTAAACAVTGVVTDPRTLMDRDQTTGGNP